MCHVQNLCRKKESNLFRQDRTILSRGRRCSVRQVTCISMWVLDVSRCPWFNEVVLLLSWSCQKQWSTICAKKLTCCTRPQGPLMASTSSLLTHKSEIPSLKCLLSKGLRFKVYQSVSARFSTVFNVLNRGQICVHSLLLQEINENWQMPLKMICLPWANWILLATATPREPEQVVPEETRPGEKCSKAVLRMFSVQLHSKINVAKWTHQQIHDEYWKVYFRFLAFVSVAHGWTKVLISFDGFHSVDSN